MKYITIIALICYLTLANSASVPDLTPLPIEVNLLNLMARSGNSRAGLDFEHMQACNDYYTKLFGDLHAVYVVDVELCSKTAADSTAAAEKNSEAKQNDLSSRTNAACAAAQQCADEEAAEQAYNCFSTASQDSSKALKAISQDASQNLLEFKSEISRIKFVQDQCNALAQAQYSNSVNRAQDDFMACMNGAPVPEVS